MNKLLNRVLVSLVFGPLTLLAFYAGGIYLQVFLGILILGMLSELRMNLAVKGVKLPLSFLVLGEAVYLIIVTGSSFLLPAVIFLALLIWGGKLIWNNQSEGALRRMSASVFGILYISWFFSAIWELRQLAGGREILLALLVCIWVTDSFAYFTGMLLGRHRGILAISPNKSLEGFLGGLVFAGLGSWVMAKAFDLPQIYVALLAFSAGLVGQFGDLFESLLKRDLGIKDSSRLMQEHGGILDRFDSMLFSAPALLILIKLLGV